MSTASRPITDRPEGEAGLFISRSIPGFWFIVRRSFEPILDGPQG